MQRSAPRSPSAPKAASPRAARFWRQDDGAALVEFAVSLPLILILSVLTVESMRLFWSYQAAIAGVRDATRYLARIAPDDLCTSGGSVAGYAAQLETIVGTTIEGAALFPAGVTITSLTPSLECVSTLGLRQASVPVATVSATVAIAMPFSQILRIAGFIPDAVLVTTVRDQARVYGL